MPILPPSMSCPMVNVIVLLQGWGGGRKPVTKGLPGLGHTMGQSVSQGAVGMSVDGGGISSLGQSHTQQCGRMYCTVIHNNGNTGHHHRPKHRERGMVVGKRGDIFIFIILTFHTHNQTILGNGMESIYGEKQKAKRVKKERRGKEV